MIGEILVIKECACSRLAVLTLVCEMSSTNAQPPASNSLPLVGLPDPTAGVNARLVDTVEKPTQAASKYYTGDGSSPPIDTTAKLLAFLEAAESKDSGGFFSNDIVIVSHFKFSTC